MDRSDGRDSLRTDRTDLKAAGRADNRRILLVGARGFIGSAIARQLAVGGWQTTHLVRRGARNTGRHPSAYGDLSDTRSLTRACSGQDIVINAASYVGSDADEQHLVNAIGSANLVSAAAAAGVSRVVYVSSTSVYGGKVVNGSAERIENLAPRSTLSVSRLAAEAPVVGNGGVILRTNLVYGPGDRFFIGPLLHAMHTLGGSIEHGRARISTISAEALARLVVETATSPPGVADGQVFHAAHPQTTTVFSLASAVLRSAGRRWPRTAFTADYALTELGGSVARSQIDMIAADNWFDSSQLWRKLDLEPGPVIDISTASKEWYGDILSRLDDNEGLPRASTASRADPRE